MTPRRTLRWTLPAAILAGLMAAGMVVGAAATSTLLSGWWLLLYVTLVAFATGSGATCLVGLSHGHIEDAFRAGALSAGRRLDVVPQIPVRRSVTRWLGPIAVAGAALMSVPVVAYFMDGEDPAPWGVSENHPEGVQDKDLTGSGTAPRCYRITNGEAWPATCEPIKRDAPPWQRPTSCWRWVALPSDEQTLASIPCKRVQQVPPIAAP